jgi:hypothetical protein
MAWSSKRRVTLAEVSPTSEDPLGDVVETAWRMIERSAMLVAKTHKRMREMEKLIAESDGTSNRRVRW